MVRVNRKLSKKFEITTGVLQGDTLTPFLFTIVLDYVLSKTTTDQGVITHIEDYFVLPDLDFAEDIVLLDENEINAIYHFTHITNVAKKVGLHANYTKTKVMFENIVNPISQKIELLDKSTLDIIDDYKYLGSYISDSYSDFRRRKDIASSIFWLLSKIWRAKDIPLKLKLKLWTQQTRKKKKKKKNIFLTNKTQNLQLN